MSEVAEKTKAPSEPLFSKKNRKLVTDPLTDNNPITIQVLGICSALAITVQVEQAFWMSASVLFVLGLGNVVISWMRNLIPSRVRIIVQLVVVASLVIIVNELLAAFVPDVSEKLSVFVGLIITNCIIMGREEAFAVANNAWLSMWDGIGNGLGYGIILVIVAFFRELLGAGTLWGIQIVPQALYDLGYVNLGLMVYSPGAFIVIGLLAWAQYELHLKKHQ